MLRVTLPATNRNLCSLRRVKRELGIDDMLSDTILLDMIERASNKIVDFTDREFAQQTYEETIQEAGSDTILLTARPVVSISSIVGDGSPVVDYILVDSGTGELYRKVGWTLAQNTGWGYSSAPFRMLYVANTRPFVVTYVAGYKLPDDVGANLPGILEDICMKIVKSWYMKRDTDPSIKGVSANGLSVTYGNIEQDVMQDLIRWQR